MDKFGVEPCDWHMAKAIGGCESDNVIGIYGVSDPKKPTSKALKYLQGKLTKGVIYNRITSKEGQKLIKKNLPIVTTPYKFELMPRMIYRRDQLTLRKFIMVFQMYGLRSFMDIDKLENIKKNFME